MIDRTSYDKYSERNIAFIDVLGFGSLVASSGENAGNASKIINQISEAILCSIEELHDLKDSSGFAFTQFSDSFVISAPHKAGRLGSFTFAILSVIDAFLSFGLLLRGGISSGPLIHDEQLLFGPAMNRAYELESRIAKTPRIIIDPNLPELAELFLFNHIAKDDDEIYFINYLVPRKKFFLIPGWLFAIQEAIEAMPNSVELREKRTWLVEKYNKSFSAFSYDDFKARLDDFVEETENNAVVEDYEIFLNDAKKLHSL